MEFKNLKLETVTRMAADNLNGIKYPDQERAFINAKIDWFSGIFKMTTIDEVLKQFHIDKLENYDKWVEAFNNRYINNFSVLNETYINFSGLNIALSNYDILRNNYDLEGLSVLDADQIVFNKIQVNISGQGLDYLRSLGLDVDLIVQNLNNCDLDFHVTRCDFAFDFINIAPTLVDELMVCCQKSETEFHRIRTGKVNGLKYSLRRGDQKTVYIGSTAGNKLLRVYDKKLEYQMSGKGETPYTIQTVQPYSWIRLELQTRRDLAEKLLYHQEFDPTYKYVMTLIHDECLPLRQKNSHDLESFETLEQVVNWAALPSIIQNIKVDQVYVDPVIKAVRAVDNNIVSTSIVVATFGIQEYVNQVFQTISEMQTNLDPRWQRRGHRFRDSIFSSQFPKDHIYSDGYKIRPVMPDVLDIYSEGKKYYEKGYLERKGIILNDFDD